MSEPDQSKARALLEKHGCWDSLWQVEDTNSGIDPERTAPFAGSHSITGIALPDAEKFYWHPMAALPRKIG